MDCSNRFAVVAVALAAALAAALTMPTGASAAQYDLVGGDRYYSGGGICTVGFPVEQPSGFVTVGHCGDVGTATTGYNHETQGTVQGSIFPGVDMGFVATTSAWTPRGWLSNGDKVRGSQEAPGGAPVCLVSATSGVRCGQITARDQTVRLPQGPVHGLIRTTICVQPGDSGAPLIWGDQAQGVASHSPWDCDPDAGVGYFQPVNPILDQFGLTLATH